MTLEHHPKTQAETSQPVTISPGIYLQVAARLGAQMYQVASANAPLQPPFVGVMFMINAFPGIRQGRCAEALGFDATTFGRYVDKLVTDGFVERSVPQADRRAICLHLTAEGEQAMKDCAHVIAGLEAMVREKMGQAAYDDFTRVLALFLQANDHPLPRLGSGERVEGS